MPFWYLFGRKKQSPASSPTFIKPAEDWKVGDLAECIRTEDWFHIIGGPAYREMHIVRDVIEGPVFGHPSVRGVGLGFTRYKPTLFQANYFRKITPQAEEVERGEKISINDLIPTKELT